MVQAIAEDSLISNSNSLSFPFASGLMESHLIRKVELLLSHCIFR